MLGPLYFIMYVNDLISFITHNTNAKIIMYADNTVLLTKHNDYDKAVDDARSASQKDRLV